jgi:hypothetical protein
MKDKTPWSELVGETVCVYMSKYALDPIDRKVTGYKLGFVNFDDESSWYHADTLDLAKVYKSNHFPSGW